MRNLPGPIQDVSIRAFVGALNTEDIDVEDKDFIRVFAHLALEELGFTGRIEAACMEFIDRIDCYESMDAFVELAVKLLAPREDVSELLSNTLSAISEIRALQRGQEMELDTVLGHLAPLARVVNGFLGLENSSVAESMHALVMRMETMGLTFVDNKQVIDLSKFMPVAEPFGASRKGVELIASSVDIRLVDGLEYPDVSSAGDGRTLDSNWTGVSGMLTRNWFMIRRRTLTVLLALWLDHRSMLRLWFIGWVMAVAALFVKSLFLPLLRDRGVGVERTECSLSRK